jgi:hypothetical protein
MKSKADVVSGIGFIVVAGWLLLYAIPYHTGEAAGYGLSPAGLPYVMALSILILAVIQVISALTKKQTAVKNGEQTEADVSWGGHGKFWLQMGLLFSLYLGGLKLIGFIPSSIGLMVFLQYFIGQRNIVLLVVLSVLIPGMLYIAFRYGIGIMLPTGILFG